MTTRETAEPAAQDRLLGLVRGGGPAGPDELGRLYDRLQPVSATFMLGTWRGGLFDESGAMAARLVKLRWYGKRFTGVEDVEPLLCRDDAGGIYSYTGMGMARLREMAFRGTVSAAMVYDDRPIIDHFRRVSQDVVMGAMDAKGTDSTLYFHLTRTN
ncbi:DUF4334 domain-containing protein [Actinomadura sp. 21ATH]|uniref:DUF4334 domain-containing protein n=1 Tax=Actinomadura sp. 21ATH TaxID=1735444 RepID=UPI0035BF459C